jgi:hypothetical protein
MAVLSGFNIPAVGDLCRLDVSDWRTLQWVIPCMIADVMQSGIRALRSFACSSCS